MGKRKLTKPVEEPRTQTSTLAPADPLHFLDAHAHEKLHAKRGLHNRSVIVELKVIFSELRHTSIPSLFIGRGWDPFFFFNLSIPSDLLVREFYSNFHDIDEPIFSFTVFVRIQSLRVSSDIIAQTFNILHVPEPTYPYADSDSPSVETMMLALFQRPHPYKGSSLYTSKEPDVVSHTTFTNMFPANHLSSISLAWILFLYVLLVGNTIDIASIIYSHMIDIFHSTSKVMGLSYACLIQRLYSTFFHLISLF